MLTITTETNSIKFDNGKDERRYTKGGLSYTILSNSISFFYEGKNIGSFRISETTLDGVQLTALDADSKLKAVLFKVSGGTVNTLPAENILYQTTLVGTIGTQKDANDYFFDTLGTKADLVNGVIPSSQLPSYVDDVIEDDFAAIGESGKIYVDTATNITYRWSGSTYVEISKSLALGDTQSTAFRGDHGKIAYDNTHTHANKAILDGTQESFTSSLKTSYDSAVSSSHTHSNKTILDGTTASFTKGLKDNYDLSYSWVNTNGGGVIYHVTNGDVHVTPLEKQTWNSRYPFLVKISKTISATINTGTSYNLMQYFSLLTDASFYNITSGAYSIANQGTANALLKLPNINKYVDYTFTIRLLGSIAGAGNREFSIEVQRSDNSVVDGANILKVSDATLNKRGVNIESLTTGSTDPFITGGAKFVIVNPSSGSGNITLTGFEILIKSVM